MKLNENFPKENLDFREEAIFVVEIVDCPPVGIFLII